MRLTNSLAGAFHLTADEGESVAKSLLLAHVISMVCLPPLLAIGTLVALTRHYVSDPSEATRIVLAASFFIAIAPAAYVAYLLKRNKINGGVDLVLKEERLRPYLVGAGSCILGLLVLVWLSAPASVAILALSYGLNAVVMAVITQRWKISAHAAGAAMPMMALFTVFGAAALPFAAIIPVVCWARVKAQMHTVAQVCAGAALGLAITWAEFAFIAH